VTDPQAITPAKIGPFIQAVIRNDSLLPLCIRKLSTKDFATLRNLCLSLPEIKAVFASVSGISSIYRGKEEYVLKRVFAMAEDERNYNELGHS